MEYNGVSDLRIYPFPSVSIRFATVVLVGLPRHRLGEGGSPARRISVSPLSFVYFVYFVVLPKKRGTGNPPVPEK